MRSANPGTASVRPDVSRKPPFIAFALLPAFGHAFISGVDFNFQVWMFGPAQESTAHYYTPNSMVTGDMLFYNCGQGLGISHAAIQVGIGRDYNSTVYPSMYVYGNLIDEHTNNRLKAFWSLRWYNLYYKTATIYFMHISAANK